MIRTKTILTLLASIFLFSVMLFSLPEEGHSGMAFSLGCCTSVSPTECLGCPDTESNCAIPQGQCLNMEGEQFFAGGQVCIDSPVGGICEAPDDTGCCVLSAGTCTDDTVVSECGGELWIESASCEAVVLCGPRSIPTLSWWGLIAMAGIIGIAGLIAVRRRVFARP